MKTRKTSTGWFKALRRDRMLFAIIGVAVLLFNMFQPLAAAGMDTDGRFVICTSAGAAGGGNGGSVPAGHECPLCIAGHCCTVPAPVFKAVLAEMALCPPLAMIPVKPDHGKAEPCPATADQNASHAIRAPPFLA